MFVLRNVGKLLFGSSSQEALCELPQGQLYLVRPLSPKGYSELIVKDAAIRVRPTHQDFQYQLVVQRVYEEGEAELLAEEEGEDAEIDALASERDEKTFLLDEALHFRIETREGGEKILAWRDLSGDTGDLYEFVCDSSVADDAVDRLLRVAKECQYERKYRKPHTTASEDDLDEFTFFEEHPIPAASPLQSPTLTRSIDSSFDIMAPATAHDDIPETPPSRKHAGAAVKAGDGEEEEGERDVDDAPPEALEIYASLPAELHVFDPQPGHFALVDDAAVATVSEVGKWQYWLTITGRDRRWVSMSVQADINPVFDFEFLSFVFNHFANDGTARSWLLRFRDQPTLEKFQEGIMQAVWEKLNETKWQMVQDKEREYVLDSFGDLRMDDAPPLNEEDEEEDEAGRADGDDDGDDGGIRNEEYDSDEEYDNTDVQGRDGGEVNSQLAVGYKHDRSFVVRGSKIGVFKHTPNNRLEFSTNISHLTTPGGKLMNPSKVMLHSEDRDLVLQNASDPNSLYRMDLEYGKVVDEWKVHDDIPVVTFGPEKKFSQMTGEQTFLGVSNNALFRIDPRASGNKLVDSELKQYATKIDFSALATTEKGFIALASNKGDIRLFDRLGIRAKTSLPALGDPIVGMDVSADGRWILATTKNYILLIDAQQHGDKNEGKLGFEKAFSADQKPRPRRLALTPEHVAQFFHETGNTVSFTPAKFNTNIDGTEETSIITATGPYIIEWNLRRIIRGMKAPYKIKRYEEEVKADDFKFGSDKNVIVALPNEVNMVAKQSLKKPTRESIMGDLRLGGGRSSGGRKSYKLGRDEIVDSPY
ncbi:hypothetical protein GMORB2_1402 [Geosmithia morbida]|uniref:Vacuolar import and degradation protein 27 n=1 Tax=Geosmithia morbida TaxID=1094350 RepID=A0A9P4YZY5_9HYPO|nr:uncharacterized protein GMORB2_1402 [Geosmithia morbida]KAF4126156.1 hypothetical protein GMORB2_1402 [Geosmithia morbida]